MQKSFSLRSLLLVYCICALTTLFYWRHITMNGATGDEPHYLVMANGLIKYGALEQTLPYKEALQPSEAPRFGIPPEQARFGRENTHAIVGPRGWFNVHNVGMPALLALPFAVGGMLAAKLVMVCGTGCIVALAWLIAGLYTQQPRQRWLAVLATCIAMPLIPAANQIYPELLAGLAALTGLYWFMTTRQRRSVRAELGLAAIVVYLPWLQIKFGMTCAVLVLAIAIKILREARDFPRVARLLASAAVSCLALLAYNLYCYGKASGPYLADAVEVSKTSLMVLMGMLFDQNQGMLLQNPILLLGLLGIGWLYRVDRGLVLTWALVFLTLLVPNSLHPNWYGGWCFSGRFGWAAAVALYVPTLYALVQLAARRQRLFIWLVSLGTLLQAYFFFRYVFRRVNMYNHGWDMPLADYSQFYDRLHGWLPALYNSDWAFSYLPNYAWLLLVAALLASGFARGALARRCSAGALLVGGVAILLAGGHQAERRDMTLAAASLLSNTGHVEGQARVAEPGKDAPGMLNFGPYVKLPHSTYSVQVKYSSTAPAAGGDPVAVFDVYQPQKENSLLIQNLPGTGGAVREVAFTFTVANWWSEPELEFRNRWIGKQDFKLYEIHVKTI